VSCLILELTQDEDKLSQFSTVSNYNVFRAGASKVLPSPETCHF
jgi:hypothetical protein